MSNTDVITTETLKVQHYQCDKPHPRNVATMSVLRNGKLDGFACAGCVTFVPGYYGNHKSTDVLDMWEVRYGTDGIGLTHGYVYGRNMAEATTYAHVSLALAGYRLQATKRLFTVHQVRAAEVARTVAFAPAPDLFDPPTFDH